MRYNYLLNGDFQRYETLLTEAKYFDVLTPSELQEAARESAHRRLSFYWPGPSYGSHGGDTGWFIKTPKGPQIIARWSE